MQRHQIFLVDWQDEASVLRAIRETVFIHEQHVPVGLEWDAFDAISLHALALSPDGCPIGTARLLPDGHIGRIAVLKNWRRQGVGSAILQRLLEEMRNRKMQQAVLHAQTSATEFYRRHGFMVVGEEFIEAGIPHIQMILRLEK